MKLYKVYRNAPALDLFFTTSKEKAEGFATAYNHINGSNEVKVEESDLDEMDAQADRVISNYKVKRYIRALQHKDGTIEFEKSVVLTDEYRNELYEIAESGGEYVAELYFEAGAHVDEKAIADKIARAKDAWKVSDYYKNCDYFNWSE